MQLWKMEFLGQMLFGIQASRDTWSKASAVVVNGDAKLTLADSRNLGRKTRLVLASESSLEIAALPAGSRCEPLRRSYGSR